MTLVLIINAVDQSRYPFLADDNDLDFQFLSEGPNGRIEKVVKYSLRNIEGTSFLNLAFGDWTEETNSLDDKATSNNRDRDKILATVAATVTVVTKRFPDIPVFAQGVTPARTRLYQMGISANLSEIEQTLDVFGLINGRPERFRRNVNYEAFLVYRKRNR